MPVLAPQRRVTTAESADTPGDQSARAKPVPIGTHRLRSTGASVDELTTARAAFAARDWIGARDAFVAARHVSTLEADDLNALAESAWWLGLIDESLAALEAAYERYLETSDHRRAAMRAFDIAYAYFLRGNETVGSGWIDRAQRLVEEEPDCAEQGYLLYFTVETSLDGGNETMVKARRRTSRAHGRPRRRLRRQLALKAAHGRQGVVVGCHLAVGGGSSEGATVSTRPVEMS